MGSILRRLARRTRSEDPDDARDALMDGIAALLNAHRTKALKDDELVAEGLLDFAAVLALSAAEQLAGEHPRVLEAEERAFAVQAINAYVAAKRPLTEEEEDEEDELG
jgi:hypothetical protein